VHRAWDWRVSDSCGSRPRAAAASRSRRHPLCRQPRGVVARSLPHAVKFVTVSDGVRIEVLDWGDRRAAGLSEWPRKHGHIFDDFAPRFTDKFHVLALTRRGWGASGHAPSGIRSRVGR